MEQIFMIEVFVKKIILKVEPPEKDEYELRMEEEERKREAEALAALEAAKKGKKGKGKAAKGGGKKGKKGKQPPPPSEEEIKFLQTCTLQMSCLPLFDFYIAHDNFIAPPPPAPPPKKGKKAKPKKPKKGKAVPQKIILPSEPLPEPPYFGVGNAIIFLSRPSKLEETLQKTPMYISVWNRSQEMNCIGYVIVEWHKTFFKCLQQASDLNPPDLEKGEYRSTKRSEIVTNTIELTKSLQCEKDLKSSGEIEFYIKLSCLGNSLVSYFVSLPEAERLPGRKYLSDDLKLKDLEVVRHWEGTLIDDVIPVAYLFGAPDITRNAIRPPEEIVVYKDFVAPYTASELEIVAMGYPKGPCLGRTCFKRMDYRGSQQFICGEKTKGKDGDKINVPGPCGRLECPLNVGPFICNEGMYKTCHKPCVNDYCDNE